MDNNLVQYNKVLFDENDIRRAIARLSHEIIESNQGINDLILLGIRTRGEHIAKRISNSINLFENTNIESFNIDIKNFRDDLKNTKRISELFIDATVHEKNLVLVDDVLYTGRTIRASLEAIFSLGRPKSIKLAALVDRGHREVPIRPDFVGKNIPTSNTERIKVFMKEEDGIDKIELIREKR
ncbi:MAG: bifunctional pyr operon transcriptional regulator/uracil phosphoribosyltransferase PyrR [Dehalococcoidia bacterium]|nr:bifunctional pyr operon transcriptional regulator/uracil phosphoribosyltransferase PyrR [Dehalococcoidia bacterium]